MFGTHVRKKRNMKVFFGQVWTLGKEKKMKLNDCINTVGIWGANMRQNVYWMSTAAEALIAIFFLSHLPPSLYLFAFIVFCFFNSINECHLWFVFNSSQKPQTKLWICFLIFPLCCILSHKNGNRLSIMLTDSEIYEIINNMENFLLISKMCMTS